MIWFNPEKDGGFDLGTPDWSGASAKVTAGEQVSNIVIGQPQEQPQQQSNFQKDAQPQLPPEPEPPPPPPEPQVDPRVENNLKLLAASISGLAAKKKDMEDRDLHFCVQMAFGIAEQLACGAIEADPTKVLDIVKESLGLFEESDKPVVRLHPDIIEAFEENDLLKSVTDQEGVTIKSDPTVSAMGCLVTANRKSVDGQVLNRLSRLKTLFNEEQGTDNK